MIEIATFGLFLTLCYMIYLYRSGSLKNKSILEKYQQMKDRLNSQKTITGDVPYNGVFEVHITIDPCDNYVKLVDYVTKSKTHAMKLVFAVSNAKNNQYMLSYFTRKEDDMDVYKGTQIVANELKQYGIIVNRIKVEGHGLQNTPMTKHDYELSKKYLAEKYTTGSPYFEFHVKINDSSGLNNIESDIEMYEGTGLSYNLCSASRKPILTIRIYNEGFIGAQLYKDNIMNSLKNNHGYSFEDKIQQEYCIYDSNTDLDAKWLNETSKSN